MEKGSDRKEQLLYYLFIANYVQLKYNNLSLSARLKYF